MTETTYKVEYKWNGGCTVVGVVNEDRLNDIFENGNHVLISVVEYAPHITYRTAEGCERCTTDEYVPHYNCLYKGKAMGHSKAHCTADSCY